MKILMLNYEFLPIGGGAAKAHLCLLRQYSNYKDLKVDVLTSAPEPGTITEKFSENINIYKVGLHKKQLHFWRKTEVIEWLAKATFHYRSLLRENDYNLVHAFFGFPTGWLCYRSVKKLPYIISLRGSDVPGYNVRLGFDYILMTGLFRKIWSGASAIVANSNGLRKLALQFMPDLDVQVIPNGIDTEIFHPSEDQKPSKPIQTLTVCRLISRKRIDLLIRAIAQTKAIGLNVLLSIAGEGNLMGELQRLTDELNVKDSVTFMGRVLPEQMPQLYRNSDIFVMSSAHEGMSNAMLEAMSSGLPIITTACEGVEELIADNGIVVEHANAEEIAKAIKKLADDRQVYKQMSIAARKRSKQFGWNKVALSYVDLYHKILN
jgi:glycosyltransferase involved in cell wall biosynthesis